AVAAYVLTGSPPNATATGIFLPSFLYSLKWRAETLCLCQCMAVMAGVNTCILYKPTFRMLVLGSFVCMIGSVRNGPPSSGQHFKTGSLVISGFFITTSW